MDYSIDSICGSASEHFNFPKAELHCHLDGCYRLTTLVELAEKRGIQLPSYDPDQLRSSACISTRQENLADYLAPFSVTSPVFAGCREAISRITREAIEDKFHTGVRYLELRFCPHLLAYRDVTPIVYAKKGDVTPRDVLETVLVSIQEAEKEFKMTVRLLLCCILDFPEWSMEIARFCEKFADRGVVGMDVAGSAQRDGPQITDHIPAFNFCKENGIHITVHAGEAGGADEVDKAMKLLHAERIGHGYHAVDDEAVYAESKRRKIHFEVCPISSFATGSVDPDLTRHPAMRFWKDRVNFSLNTDDPGVHQKNLLDDYNVAVSKFNFSVETIKQLNLNALRSSFCEKSVKEKLLEDFEEAYRSQ